MTYNEAIATIPASAKWSASFGNPGDGGYSEFHRTPEGVRFVVSNGNWMDFAPFVWSVKELPPMPAP